MARAACIMKINNGTELRFARPKYSRIWSPLFVAGFGLVAICHFIYPRSPDWPVDIGYVLLGAGLIVSLVGAVAERREWQAKHQAEGK